jgi:hypothetical protein
MNDNSLNQLQTLRTNVLDSLSGMADQLADDDLVGFDALIAIARTTGRPEMLIKAYQKAQKLPQDRNTADAMLQILEEIEVMIAGLQPGKETVQPTQTAPVSQPPVQDTTQPAPVVDLNAPQA